MRSRIIYNFFYYFKNICNIFLTLLIY